MSYLPDTNAIVEELERQARTLKRQTAPDWTPEFSSWRHGGWYVDNLRHVNGGCGCVSRNYADKKWRIVCDERPFGEQPTFKNRVEAALAERDLVTEAYFARLDGYR